MKTPWTKESEIKRSWYLVDAGDQILGRVATRIATLLMGKGKVNTVPNLDCGDYVIVVNASKIKLTRGKEEKKMYYSHSGYPGGFKEIRFDALMEKDARKPLQLAVKRMLPQNKQKDTMMARLFIYTDGDYKQQAQNPVEVKLS